ncbi:zinc finger MYM-type protein 1-like [Brassica napus]|uniref:zinc finger MYM-type protein 1-like n=1 Tax=Brassica napus TaxID=3708 RepID=UPI002079BF89|nr:zinc finger MYM-type protein 1-like [Brassica napus]
MEKYFKKVPPPESDAKADDLPSNLGERKDKRKSPPIDNTDIEDLPSDPGERKDIMEYLSHQRDEVRHKYLTKGPCQPYGHTFKQILKSGSLSRFNPAWFDQYGSWLEYSISKERAFCLYCYLFKDEIRMQGGSDAFVKEGFNSWNKPDRLRTHMGKPPNSFHIIAAQKCEDLMNQNQSIVHALFKQDDKVKNEYRIRLTASIDASRFLLRQGLSFRGHFEKEEAVNKGNFLQLLKYTGEQNETISKVILSNAPGNNQMVSPLIQKDIVHSFAEEVRQAILEEIGHDVFGLLVDESADVSHKEQMGVVFRFVDKRGAIKERFIGVVHVKETSSLALKSAIDDLFARYGMSIKKVRGQGYDGASNMRGEFNGLRSLVARENSSAYYVHCFAHQLQLVVVAVAKKHFDIADFFDMISTLLNVVGASCKRQDKFREIQREELEKQISSGEVKTGTGQNQERSLPRPANTRWGSHHKTLLRLEELFSTTIKVLEYVQEEGMDDLQKRQACGLLKYFHTFDCVFYLHLMLLILGLTANLSLALQEKDQNILNAMSLVESTKRELQKLRDDGWSLLMDKLLLFIQEFNDRFTEVTTDLLICMAALSPTDSFYAFDKEKLVRLAKLYPEDFTYGEILSLEQQLDIYIDNIRRDERFKSVENLGDLSCLMVKTQKHIAHPLVYRLLKLVLTLPVATASVERCFSAMKLVKTAARNRIGDQFLSDCMVCFVEKELLDSVSNEKVIERFQKMNERRVVL